MLTLAGWTDEIRSGKWKNVVERLRRCRQEGRAEEADRLKGSLPGLICAGDCMQGRHLKQLAAPTGIAMFDQDKLSPEELERTRTLLKDLPWVKAGHVTSSGCGWRTFVRLGEVPHERYGQAYALVAQAIGELTGVECDMQCKNLCRLSFASWDEEAFCKEETALFPYPEGVNVFAYAPPEGEDFSEDFRRRNGGGFPHPEREGNGGIPAGGASPFGEGGNPEEAAPHYEPLRDPSLFLSTFFGRKPFVEGSRHHTLLALGRYIRWKCLSPDDLLTLTQEAFRTCGGLSFGEFRKAMEWGYRHGEENPSPGAEKGFRVQKVPFDPISERESVEYAENEEDAKFREEELLSSAPYIPEEVYGSLPSLLREGAAVARTRRERDMLLLAMLANLSGAMPGVRTVYARREYSPHLYFAAVAPAGSGKGVTAWGAELLKRVDAELREENRRRKKEYQSRLLAWEQEVRLALREKRKPDETLRPEEPVCRVLLLPPNTSKSQLILDLETAGEMGVVCNATEIDSFTSSIGNDAGKYSAELRKAFHHEAVGQHYKVDGRVVMVEHPRLALCMAGTLQQFTDFIGTKEDGLLSRFLFCMGKGTANGFRRPRERTAAGRWPTRCSRGCL